MIQTVRAGEGDEDKFVLGSRADEPKSAWKSEKEKEGRSPLQDPMAIAAIMGLVVPFTILLLGIASGYIELH